MKQSTITVDSSRLIWAVALVAALQAADAAVTIWAQSQGLAREVNPTMVPWIGSVWSVPVKALVGAALGYLGWRRGWWSWAYWGSLLILGWTAANALAVLFASA